MLSVFKTYPKHLNIRRIAEILLVFEIVKRVIRPSVYNTSYVIFILLRNRF